MVHEVFNVALNDKCCLCSTESRATKTVLNNSDFNGKLSLQSTENSGMSSRRALLAVKRHKCSRAKNVT